MSVKNETGLSQPILLGFVFMGIIGLVGVMAFFLLSSPEQGEGFSDLRVEARDEPSITPDTAAEDAVEDRVPLESDLPEGRLSLSGRLTLNANLLPDIMIQAIPDAVEPLPASLREMLKFSPLVDESPDNELRKMLDTESREAETTIIECESGPHGEFTLQVPKSETLSFRLDHDFYYLPKEQAGPLAWDLEGDLPELIGYESRLEARLGALILGEVVDNEGLPVSGAGVEIEQETGTRGMDSAFASMMGAGRMRAQTVTTDQGFFSLRAVEPGTGLILRAECEGLVAAKSEIFDAAPGQTVRIQVRLGEGSTLKARVRGPEDEPLVNAQVFLHRERERESDATRGFMRMGGSRIVDSGKTDEKGSVLFTALGPGEYSVSAAYPGMCELSESSEAIVIRKVIRAYETTVDLAWGEVIAGTIMDDAGTPVEGARVVARIHIDMQGGGMRSMMRGAFTSPDRVSNEAMSQAGGGFRITGLEPDAVYDLITEQSGFTPSSESGIESGRKDLKIVLERMGQIEGTVLVRLSQTPVESFKIRIAPKDPGDDGRADFRGRGRDTGDTDRDGNQRGRNPGNRPDRGMIFGGRGAGPEMGSSSMSRLFETMRNSMTARFASPSRFTDKEEEFVDSEGRFSLKEIIPGEYVLCVSAKGCAPLISEPIVVEKNSTVRNVAIRLGPGASVSGRVEGLHGPVPKVRIRINADDDQTGSVESMDMLLETVDSCRTLKDGSFVITGLPEGRFILQADHPDYPDTRSDPFPLREGQVLGGLVIPLPMGGRVVGTAVDVHGMPLTSAQVLCSGDRGGRNRSRFTVTDSQGAFEILGLREGSYSVRLVSGRRDFFARENSPSSAAVTLAEGETREVYLQETPSSGVTVKGRITYNGVPLKSGFMTATADAGGAPAFSSIYNDGTYALDDVTAGENRFTVRFGDAGDMESVTLRFHIPEQDEVSLDMDLPDARIQGRVTDGVTGMALQGVNLSISSESDDDSSMQGWFRNRKTATTGIDGSYTFKMLSPGTYRIRAESSGSADVEGKAVGYYPAEVNAIRIIENQNLQNLNIALYMGGGIEVQVFQENGLPLDRATVIAVPTEEEDAALPTQSSRERTDAEGVALIEPIEPGDYTLTVQARNMGQAIKEGIRVSAGAVQKVSVSLTAGFTISIRLKDTTGAPIEEARLTLRDAQNRKLSLPPTRMGRGGFFGSGGQEEAGLYRLGSLVPGAYSIEASWGDRTGVAEFNVSRDAELSLVPR